MCRGALGTRHIIVLLIPISGNSIFHHKGIPTTRQSMTLYNSIGPHLSNNKTLYTIELLFKTLIDSATIYNPHSFNNQFRTEMQLTTLLVAALSASTLTIAAPTFNSTDPFAYELTFAAPTFNSTDPFAYDEESEGGIEKRGSYGWLSSFRMTGKRIFLDKPI